MPNKKISACIITYNHEEYIAECLEGALKQELDYDYEINIFEDCSTDKTREVVLAYKQKYPEKINLFLNEKNLGLVGNWIQALKSCKGDYIALCEGDDFWTHPQKLQKQVDFLENNPSFTIASHNANIIIGDKTVKLYCGPKHPQIMDLKFLLTYASGVPTCSLVVKSESIKKLPDWFDKIQSCDWTVQVVAVQSGKMKYFNEIMSTYRRQEKGALYYQKKAATANGESTFCIPGKCTLALIDILDEYFQYKYSKNLDILKIYSYDLYVRDYLEIAEIKMARKYYFKILKRITSSKYWKYPAVPPRRILKLLILLLPDFIIKQAIIKKYKKNTI